MKLPRWLVLAMLTTSVLSVLAAAGWWWVTRPERTATEFVDLMAEDRADEVKRTLSDDVASFLRLLDSPIGRTFSEEEFPLIQSERRGQRRLHWKQVNREPKPRTILDQVKGRQEVKLGLNRFVVQRGMLIDFGLDDPNQGFSSYLHYIR